MDIRLSNEDVDCIHCVSHVSHVRERGSEERVKINYEKIIIIINGTSSH